MEMTQISIDFDVYKAIQQRLESFNDTPNQVLRRVFELEPIEEKSPESQGESMYAKGVLLKDGLRLRKRFKGRMLEARVENGKILHNGSMYTSPSGAAVAATGTSVNGWRFWEYFDDASGFWRSLDTLRRK